jgi:proteasome assembly chaperone (PAC2) family protein
LIGLPTPEHLLFIPGVLLIGITIGYMLGGRAARSRLETQRRRARE